MLMKRDVESGGDGNANPRPLYPAMLENPQLRWAFIRKVYTILTIQLLLTIAVASVVVFVRPIALFFVSSPGGLALYIVLLIAPLITVCPLYYYHQKHPLNYILLFIFTVTLAFAVGLTCAFTSGRIILESVILTTIVVVSLTLYLGHQTFVLGLFLPALHFQLLFPLGRISTMIYGVLASIIFSGYIIYDTNNLIKRYTYDQYIWASVALYLDVINLFLSLLTIFRAVN
ncbi:BI1-like protein [Glycine soja]|nr:BI1-like protein [Glycine soja]